MSTKFYQPQIIFNNSNQYTNQIQKNKTIYNFSLIQWEITVILNVFLNKSSILSQNFQRYISVPVINQKNENNNNILLIKEILF